MLVKNMLIKWLGDEASQDRTERILWIDPGRTYLFTFDMDDQTALPVRKKYEEIVQALNEAEAVVVCDDDDYLLQPDEQFSKNQRQRRDENWSLIESIVNAEGDAAFVPEKRGKLVEAVKERTGRAKRLLYDYLRRYWRAGQMKNALIPRYDRSGLKSDQPVKPGAAKRGLPRQHSQHPGVNIDQNIKKRLEKGYNRFYASGECKTLAEAYRQTMITFFRTGQTVDEDGIIQPIVPPLEELPSLGQFKYHCHQSRNRLEVLVAREGQSRVGSDYSSKLGSAFLMAFGPGAWFLLDSTPADCLLVSSLNRSHVLGKPTLYFVKDLFSLLIVGFAVSLEEASWIAEVLAIQNATRDKVLLCQEYGITITTAQWSSHYLPVFMLNDRGEGESPQSSNLVNSIGVQLSNTPPYRPDLKGPVELDFHLANHYALHQLPGGGPAPEKRGDKDQRGLPCLTPYEFRRGVISYILSYNKSHIIKNYPFDEFMIADEVKPVPIHLWNWGIENRSGHLRTMPPDVVYRNLLPRAQATVTRQGVEFKELRFFSQYAYDNHWYLKAGQKMGKASRRVTIAYDPRTTNYIFLCLKGQAMERCPLLEKDQGYANREWIEVEAQKKFEAGQRIELENNRFQALIELQARLDHISKPAQQEAEVAREQASIGKSTPAKDKRQHMARERSLERRKDTGVETEANLAQLEVNPASEQLPPKHQYIPQADYSDIINEAIEEEQRHV
jgi:hypothetical protein